MADHIQTAVHESVHSEPAQDPGFDLLVRHPVLAVDHRVIDMIIKDPGRDRLLPRMPVFLHFQRRIHIDHELKLQSVI